MNVFVLGTGRCGTTTFARACSHLSNYTVGQESRAARYGDARFGYPRRHVEVDPRLTWFLGELAQRFPGARYVHLRREPEATARSVERRLRGGRASFGRAFAESIIMRGQPWPGSEQLDVARFYVRTARANIEEFLRWRQYAMRLDLEDIDEGFPRFLEWIGAEGDLDAAVAEWGTRYNATPQLEAGRA